jgi:hypothetical protein
MNKDQVTGEIDQAVGKVSEKTLGAKSTQQMDSQSSRKCGEGNLGRCQGRYR